MRRLSAILCAAGLLATAAAAQNIIVPTACVLENARPDSVSDGPYLQNDPPTPWWNSAGIITNQALIADGEPIPASWPQHEYGYSVSRAPRVRDTAETVGGASGVAELTFDLGGVVEVEGIVLWNAGEGTDVQDSSDRGVQTAGISWSSNGVDFISSGETLSFAKGPQGEALIDADPQYLTASLPGVTHIRMAVTNFAGHTIIGFSEIRFLGTRPPDLYYVSGTPVDWNSASAWSDGNPATTDRHYVVTNGVVLNTPATTETFAGASLTLEPAQRLDVLVSNNDVITVGDLILNAAEVAADSSGSGEAQIDGQINVGSSSTFSGTTRDLRILSRVNGGGAASVELDAPAQTIYIDNAANSLSGTWVVSDGTAEFASGGAVGSASIIVSNGTLRIDSTWSGLTSGASLTVIDSSAVTVEFGANTWKVDSLMVGSSNLLTDSIYDAAALNALGSAVFAGTGVIQVGTPPVPPAPANSLVHHWKFDDGTGNIAIDSAGSNNALISGAIWTNDAARGTFLSFGGVNDSVDPSLFLPQWSTTNAETWAVWVNAGAGNVNDIILGNRLDGTTETTDGTRLFAKMTTVDTSNGRFVYNDGTPYQMNLSDGGRTETLPVGEWYHLAVVRDGADFTFYVNGTAYSSPSYTIPPVDMPTAAIPFFMGGEPGAPITEHFLGGLDDVVIYNYALAASNVVDVMNGIYDFGPVDLSNAITEYNFNPSGTSSLSFTGGVNSAYVIKSANSLTIGGYTTVTPSAVTTGSLAGDVITTDGTGSATAEFTETAPAQFYKVESAP